MELIVNPSALQGTIPIPGSKSHTIRALVMAMLAGGTSKIYAPLTSGDTLSCLQGCRAFGAEFADYGEYWQIQGTDGQPRLPQDIIDVGNSGTTLNFLTGSAALIDGYTILTGDGQIKRRPSYPLLDALAMLGVTAHSAPQTGCPPLVVRGRMKGGYTEVKSKVSQYLSSLLLNCPLAPADTEIKAIDLGEKPYVEMTLSWLKRQNIAYQQEGLEHFWIKGGQSFKPLEAAIPADFSSATFFLGAAAMPGCELTLTGLDFDDPQGDKAVVDLLRAMGADITVDETGTHLRGRRLTGAELDLGDMPDALPVLAVVGALASGTTRLRNVAHARLKETDRITTMRRELAALGADIAELEDGLLIRESRLRGGVVNSHHDHRIAMALAMAGLAAAGPVRVLDAEAVGVTFPQFPDLLRQLGTSIEVVEGGQ
jgi:3-phosphoshikimate 1-carboxyvinyltransferase